MIRLRSYFIRDLKIFLRIYEITFYLNIFI